MGIQAEVIFEDDATHDRASFDLWPLLARAALQRAVHPVLTSP
jgi:hypothetical protein